MLSHVKGAQLHITKRIIGKPPLDIRIFFLRPFAVAFTQHEIPQVSPDFQIVWICIQNIAVLSFGVLEIFLSHIETGCGANNVSRTRVGFQSIPEYIEGKVRFLVQGMGIRKTDVAQYELGPFVNNYSKGGNGLSAFPLNKMDGSLGE